MHAETDPLIHKEKQTIELKEVLDIGAVQSLMDDFYSLTNIGVAITDLHGEVLIATGWQDVCTKFHRINCATKKNCLESDIYLSENVEKGEFKEYKCKNNMWDISTPIFVCDQHVGNLFLGQFFYIDEEINVKVFEEQAVLYGFDNDSYLDALRRVPRWSRQKVKTVMDLYSKFAQIISKLLTSNLSLEKSLEDNKKTIKELELSNKDLEQFAYVASHDLKEPLRMVSSYTQLLEKKYKNNLDDEADKYISFVTSGVQRMHCLITELLKYSRINKEKRLAIVDCNKIICEVMLDLAVAIEEKHAEIFYSSLPVIKANPTQVKQLFQNLIENAIKFNNHEKPEISISSRYENGQWIFEVKDNGIGISPEYYSKIFSLFQRLHANNEYSGSGVGLAVSKKIVERSGGNIWVESEPGVGSTFYFTFPGLEQQNS